MRRIYFFVTYERVASVLKCVIKKHFEMSPAAAE